MSEHKIQGGDMLLFIDPNGGTNYDTVVCLTSVSQNDSVQPVDASSACGPDKSPGAVDISVTFEGQHLQDPDSGKISGTNLLQLLRAEQTIGWKLSPVSPQAGDEIQEGTGYLSELSSTYSYSEIGVFSGTIQPYGLPTSTIQPSGPSLAIGDFYEGGTIAYLDGTGQHGFVFFADLGAYAWQELPLTVTGATATAFNTGGTNTDTIIASGAIAYSAYTCINGLFNGYNDWKWPSLLELNQIYVNNPLFPTYNFNGVYWSSSEVDLNNAYYVDFNAGYAVDNKNSIYNLIPIRYF